MHSVHEEPFAAKNVLCTEYATIFNDNIPGKFYLLDALITFIPFFIVLRYHSHN